MPQTKNRPSSPEAVQAGQAVYTATTLKIYDVVVLGLSNYLLWRCPTHRLMQFYQQNMRGEHLELGVGSAFFPTHNNQPAPERLVLVDLNPQTLIFGQQRIGRDVRTYQRNVLEPLDLPEHPFDSVAMNYLLHCIPGDIRDKACAFDHASAYLKKGGVLFGSTLLQGDVPRNLPAQALMKLYNYRGIFHNEQDQLSDLRQALAARFKCFGIEIHGCAALFWAIKT